MNYAYVYINKLEGNDREDLLQQLQHSVASLKEKEKDHGSIHIFSDITDLKIKDYCKGQGCFNKPTKILRNYSGNGSLSLIDILTEKIIQLKNFDKTQDVALIDVDTEFTVEIPKDYWQDDCAVFWKAEYYITQFRNLDRVLPQIPWAKIDIEFDPSFIMYNTGVVYIPKLYRKEICEKALWITDFLNNGKFLPEERYGNKLDEQIGLSIAVYDVYGRQGKIKTCEHFIHHYWEEKTKNIRWWE
jgi:hypothetical protein